MQFFKGKKRGSDTLLSRNVAVSAGRGYKGDYITINAYVNEDDGGNRPYYIFIKANECLDFVATLARHYGWLDTEKNPPTEHISRFGVEARKARKERAIAFLREVIAKLESEDND